MKTVGNAVLFVGVAAIAIQRFTLPPKAHEIMKDYPNMSSKYPSLAVDLSKLLLLTTEERLRGILRMFDEIAVIDNAKLHSSQWRLARLIKQINTEMSTVMSEVEIWKSDDLFLNKQLIEEDTLPAIEQHLDNILHNHLMTVCA